MIRSGKFWIVLCIICLSSFPVHGQQFNYSAKLDTVTTSGFYAITISPQLSAYIKTNMADIRIANKNKQWVPHILQVDKTSYQDNPTAEFSQTDTGIYSYIKVKQKNNYQFNRITLAIGGTKYYSRDMQIYLPRTLKFSNSAPGNVLGYFRLMSALPASFELPRTKTSLFFIVIKNADNPPLKIEKVLIQQQPVSLITYLEKGKSYSLMFGDSLALLPDYDLQAFKDSISAVHPLSYGNIQAVKKDSNHYTASNTNWWIWATIVFAGAVLSILTYRLTGEINRFRKD